jgi:DNA-binding ferritin-like protein
LQWKAYGREFLSAPRHLDRVLDEWRELEDAVAERAAAIGIAPDGGAAAVIELADVRPVDSGFTEVGCAIVSATSSGKSPVESGSAQNCLAHLTPSPRPCS